eukprot:scaffold4081_cov145-Skeletonema_menzelii.AAC.8
MIELAVVLIYLWNMNMNAWSRSVQANTYGHSEFGGADSKLSCNPDVGTLSFANNNDRFALT